MRKYGLAVIASMFLCTSLAHGNMIVNGDFESGTMGQIGAGAVIDGWTNYNTHGYYIDAVNHTAGGSRSVQTYGSYTAVYLASPIAVQGGAEYDLQGYAFTHSWESQPDGRYSRLYISWSDSNGQDISGQVEVGIYNPFAEGGLDEWHLKGGVIQAPTNAVSAIVGIQSMGVTGGGIYWDDISMTQVPEPATLGLIGVGLAGMLLRRQK